ncbi:hypothetical protein AgCh_011723 [Apium graveolens]
MDLLGSSIAGEVGLRLLLSPLNSTIVMRTACCSVGIVVPVYSSVKAIERGTPQDQQKWLLYWAVVDNLSERNSGDVNEVPESSTQGTLEMFQQEFQNQLAGTDEKLNRLQEQFEKLIVGLNRGKGNVLRDEIYGGKEDGDYKENISPRTYRLGLFKDPYHAASKRQRLFHHQHQMDDDPKETEVLKENFNDSQSLKHLKLSFPVYKEGSDSMEWLRNCEEYFSIYDVPDRRRAVIAAMHLSGVPRSWYKSFMIGKTGINWLEFSEAFTSRFGELDTDLVFEKFKKLQQTKSVEEYYDEFERCRGQLLQKIPSLTSEYFLENFVVVLQGDIKGMIRLLEPSSLSQALKVARYYEQTLNSQPRKYNTGTSYKANTSSQYNSKSGISTEKVEEALEYEEEARYDVYPEDVEESGQEGVVLAAGRWVIGSQGSLGRQIFEELHSIGIGGHSGIKATIRRIEEYFSWSTLKQDVGRWVRECGVCQEVKGENIKKHCLLQPLAIPQMPWRDIAMDFITGLPKSQGFEVIWVVVDRFSRYAHFLALQHPISAKSLAHTFFDHIYRLHGLPESIVSDRDSLFLSEFWRDLFKICGTKLCMSTAYHPQSDGVQKG